MSFFQKLKNIAKSNWSFLALVIFPVVRLIWRAVMGTSAKEKPRAASPSGNVYKRGDVIDVEVRKEEAKE